MGARFAGALAACLVITGLAAPGAGAAERAYMGAEGLEISMGADDRATISWAFQQGRERVFQSTTLDDDGNPGQTTASTPAPRPLVGPAGHRAYVSRFDTGFGIAMLDTAGAVSSFHFVPAPSNVGYRAALDATGRISLAWREYANAGQEIKAVRTDADGAPGPTRTLFNGPSLSFDLAIDSAGVTTIARTARNVEAVRLGPDGDPGPTVTISTDYTLDVDVEVDSRDRATIAWTGRSALPGPTGQVQVRAFGADGMLGETQAIATGQASPRLFPVPGAGLLALWNDFAEGNTLRAAWIDADGAAGEARTISPPSARSEQVVVDRTGAATMVWRRDGAIEYVRFSAEGEPGAIRSLAPRGDEPGIAIDSRDRVTIAWTTARGGRPYENFGTVQYLRVAADGTAGGIRNLTPADTSPPDLTLTGEKQQFGASISITAGCDEWCDLLFAPGLKIVPKRGRGDSSGRVIALEPGSTTNLCTDKLGSMFRCQPSLQAPLAGAPLRRVERALDRRMKVVATWRVLAVDDAGNTDLGTHRVRVRAPRP